MAAEETVAAETQETPVPQTKVIEVVKTVVDTSGYDMALKNLDSLIERVDVDDVPELEKQRSEIEKARDLALANASKEDDTADFEEYKRTKVDKQLREILPDGYDISKIRGETSAEKLANAQMIAEASAPALARLAEMEAARQTGAPTPEQIAAHGTPMVPGGEINVEDEKAKYAEMVKQGDVRGMVQSPLTKTKIKEWLKIK